MARVCVTAAQGQVTTRGSRDDRYDHNDGEGEVVPIGRLEIRELLQPPEKAYTKNCKNREQELQGCTDLEVIRKLIPTRTVNKEVRLVTYGGS